MFNTFHQRLRPHPADSVAAYGLNFENTDVGKIKVSILFRDFPPLGKKYPLERPRAADVTKKLTESIAFGPAKIADFSALSVVLPGRRQEINWKSGV